MRASRIFGEKCAFAGTFVRLTLPAASALRGAKSVAHAH